MNDNIYKQYPELKKEDINKLSYGDIGVIIMRKQVDPISWKDLLLTIVKIKWANLDHYPADLLSTVHTEICMDSRFTYQSEGKWILTELLPAVTKRIKRTKHTKEK